MERANTEENITVDIILANFNWNKCHTQDERNIIFNLSQDKSLVNPMYK